MELKEFKNLNIGDHLIINDQRESWKGLVLEVLEKTTYCYRCKVIENPASCFSWEVGAENFNIANASAYTRIYINPLIKNNKKLTRLSICDIND